ncbi:MAG: regulatory protein RecX [Luminiphilus sp.]|nr:regulatory protein RecX [Luminiphilus sp.]
MESPLNPTDVRRAAMDLLARREHGVEELKLKLKRRFGREEDFETIAMEQLQRLVDEDLLSDARFSAAMVRQLINKGIGPRRLDGELRGKGIEQSWQDCAASADLEVDWHQQAQQVYGRKFPQPIMKHSPDDRRREWGKRARFMQYRGFEPEHFMGLINDASGNID